MRCIQTRNEPNYLALGDRSDSLCLSGANRHDLVKVRIVSWSCGRLCQLAHGHRASPVICRRAASISFIVSEINNTSLAARRRDSTICGSSHFRLGPNCSVVKSGNVCTQSPAAVLRKTIAAQARSPTNKYKSLALAAAIERTPAARLRTLRHGVRHSYSPAAKSFLAAP